MSLMWAGGILPAPLDVVGHGAAHADRARDDHVVARIDVLEFSGLQLGAPTARTSLARLQPAPPHRRTRSTAQLRGERATTKKK